MSDDRPGLQLARRFYREAVAPIVNQVCPGLAHAAARIGRGSEVLGFDDAVSHDHDWGPRLDLFMSPEDLAEWSGRLVDALADRLPRTFGGFSTSFAPDRDGVTVMVPAGDRVAHRVQLGDIDQWCETMLGFDPRVAVGWFDWLATSSHRLAEVTGGEVFHDGIGDVTAIRAALAFYPNDVWLFVLASQWRRLAQEEAFVGRCAQVGDELGSAVVAARLARDVMRLCLMMERRYVPYSKWLGTAFGQLGCARLVRPSLRSALETNDGQERQRSLALAYQAAAQVHNSLELTEPLDTAPRAFWTRGFPVIFAERFATALRQRISDGDLRALPLVGSVDQFVDSTDVLCDPSLSRAAASAVLRGSGKARQS